MREGETDSEIEGIDKKKGRRRRSKLDRESERERERERGPRFESRADPKICKYEKSFSKEYFVPVCVSAPTQPREDNG